jgi:signal transduction histidine kinase
MPPLASPAPLPATVMELFPPAELLAGLLDISLAGAVLLTPLYGDDNKQEVRDYAIQYANPAALHMLRLPAEEPMPTYLQHFPNSLANGAFAFLNRVLATGEPARHERNYQADGLDNHYYVAARRVGAGLLLSVTDTADHPRTAVENALRESQAREQAARLQAEAKQQQLQTILNEAPVAIAYLQGPELVVATANAPICDFWARTADEVLGRPLAEAVPELREQGFALLMADVFRTGIPFVGTEVPATMPRNGQLQTNYYNFVCQPLRDEHEVVGVLDVAIDVTELVLARQVAEEKTRQAHQLNEELGAVNARLQAAWGAAEQAQAEAEAGRQELRTMFMEAPAMICIFAGPDHVFELVNPLYQELVGNRSLLGRPIKEAMPELTGQPIFGLLDGVYQTGVPFTANEMLVQLDQHNQGGQLAERYYNFTYQPRRDARGTISGVLVFAYDVTPQVQARRRVEESEQEMAAMNEELHVSNEELQVTNQELFLTEQQLRELNHELEARVLERTVQQQAAQYEAERQRTRLERLFMQAPAAICILDGPELVYELVNPGYQQLFTGRKLQGLPLLRALPEIADHAVYRMFRSVYVTGVTSEQRGLLIPIVRPGDGALEDRYFNFIIQARYSEQGGIDGVLVFAFEVTEQVQAGQQVQALNERLQLMNAELADSNRRLTRTNQDLDNFVYAASHDLKQPVNNLTGLFDELRLNSSLANSEEQELLLPMIQEALHQLSATIEDLAAVGYSQQVPTEHAEPVNLEEMVQDVLLTLEPQVRAANAHISTDFAVRPLLSYSRANLRTVLLNLLSNSLKYADPLRPVHIRVSLRLDHEHPVLEVEDNGLGFDASRHAGELFQLFRRFHDHTEGTGVGLYLVNRIVQANGGSIEVESQVGEGATFRVRLGQ